MLYILPYYISFSTMMLEKTVIPACFAFAWKWKAFMFLWCPTLRKANFTSLSIHWHMNGLADVKIRRSGRAGSCYLLVVSGFVSFLCPTLNVLHMQEILNYLSILSVSGALCLIHRFQQPIPKLRILNFYELFYSIRLFLRRKQ